MRPDLLEPLTLRFTDRALEREYQAELGARARIPVRCYTLTPVSTTVAHVVPVNTPET